ncbi:type VII secretion target [Nocardia abscessus]|uniref:type VII secretion target n=1 Tax=Nocardia abscessus TaxID=120957 RepID=UPI00245446D5|nr:type VII secretion target [Nocardia abscessus]
MSDGGTPASITNLSVVPEKVREAGMYVYELAEALRTALDSAAKDVSSLTDGFLDRRLRYGVRQRVD